METPKSDAPDEPASAITAEQVLDWLIREANAEWDRTSRGQRVNQAVKGFRVDRVFGNLVFAARPPEWRLTYEALRQAYYDKFLAPIVNDLLR